jgi:peptidoglycan hydrolase-like protein with peptidoglycan-binding domain
MALRRVPIPSPNYSSRGGAKVRLIVLHTAEGAQSYQSLGTFFRSPSAGVSSHVGIDDTPGTIGEYVRRDFKAWTASNANPVAVQVELCAFARWTAAEWDRHPAMLKNVADWIAEEARRYGIPIVRLTAGQAQGSGQGVCQHKDLGSWGGGHWDCGPGFPIDRVVNMARGAKPGPAPKPPPAGKAPPFPGTLLKNYIEGHGTQVWQTQMRKRGWKLTADGKYGNESEKVCRQFQAEKGLGVDGIVGPATWNAAWTAPIS